MAGRSRTSRALRRVLLAAPLPFLLANSFRIELRCEEAVKHIADCCPKVEPSHFQCVAGCEESPSIPQPEAECLLALDCDEIRARDYCTKFASPPPSGTSYSLTCP